MTEKEYEGTPELIFYCEYNPHDFEDRLEIPFTNDYDIKLNFSRDTDNQIRINVDLQPKESNIPKGFFGKNILNITAIVGKNGVGKTFLLGEFSQSKRIKENNFFIYKSLDGSKFYINNIDQYVVNVDIGILDDEQIKNGNIYINFSGKLTETIYHNYNKWKFIFSENLSFFMKIDKICKIQLKKMTPRPFLPNNMKQDYPDDDLQEYINKLEGSIRGWDVDFDKNFKEKFIIRFWQIIYLLILKKHQSSLMTWDEYLTEQGQNAMSEADPEDRKIREAECAQSAEDYQAYLIKIQNLLLYEQDLEDHNKILSIIFDEYREDKHCVMKMIELTLEKIDKSFFQRDGLVISESDNFKENYVYINDLIRGLDQLLLMDEFDDLCKFSFGSFSSGEMQLIDCFSCIVADINSIDKKEIINILLDEPDSRIHPEWSRKYLSYLLKFLDAEGERLGIKFQVVLTTHSPYLISDLPKENIILLEKDDKTGRRTARKSNYGFASNYYDIMSDSFFLDDTIGEFAKQKINECIRKMNTITYLLKKIKDNNLVISKLLNKKIPIRMKGIEQIISIVGDPYIQKPLEGMLSALLDQLNSLKPKQKSLDEILRERQIALQSSGVKND